MSSCPACHNSLFSQTVDAWVCSSCGYKELRDDGFAMGTRIIMAGHDGSVHILRPEYAAGTFRRFHEIRAKDKSAALLYLEFAYFSPKDDLNRYYLAARLATELHDQQSAQKHLDICLKNSVRAKYPAKLEELKQLFASTFL